MTNDQYVEEIIKRIESKNKKIFELEEKVHKLNELTELKDKNILLAKENVALRDELAIILNKCFVLENRKERDLIKSKIRCCQEVNQYIDKISQFEQELHIIKGSYAYKLWQIYKHLPSPIRDFNRGCFGLLKKIIKLIRRN